MGSVPLTVLPLTATSPQFQRHRMLQWLYDNPNTCNEVMETVISSLTNAAPGLKPRQWRSMTMRNCRGRFVPTERPSAPAAAAPTTYMDWVRAETQSVDTEVNVQMGEVCLVVWGFT